MNDVTNQSFVEFIAGDIEKTRRAEEAPWPPLCRVNGYIHNNRTRYSSGYYCRDCDTFFPKSGPTFQRTEYLTDLWMALHNINAIRLQKKLEELPDVKAARDAIGLGPNRVGDYRELIKLAEETLARYQVKPDAAVRTLSAP